MTRVEPWRVVVAGGGVAGIEALLGLRTLGEGCLQLTLVTPDLHFVLRPHAVAEPFGGAPSPSLPYADIAREQGARFVRDRVRAVRADDRVLELERLRRAAVRRRRARRRSAGACVPSGRAHVRRPGCGTGGPRARLGPDARPRGVRGARRPDRCVLGAPDVRARAHAPRPRAPPQRPSRLVRARAARGVRPGAEPSRRRDARPRGRRGPRRRGPHRVRGWARHRARRRWPVALRRPHRRTAAARRPSAAGRPTRRARLHPRRRARSCAGARSRVRRRRRHGPRDQAGRARGAAGGRGDPAPDGRGRRAPAPRSVPSCPARSAHDRPGRSLPASRSGSPATPSSTSPCGSPPRRWSATTSRPGWRTCIPPIPCRGTTSSASRSITSSISSPWDAIERQRS